MMIETRRLLLRKIVSSDAEDMFAYSRGPNTGLNAGWKPHESLEETQETIDTFFLNQESVFGIVLTETNKLIGSIGLIKDPMRENDSTRMLGYDIGEDYWGLGIMTEAAKAIMGFGFETMFLDLISATCYPYNIRSRHVLEKLGFQYEGTLAQADKRYDGQVMDMECFSLSKEDYFKSGARDEFCFEMQKTDQELFRYDAGLLF
ncbi:MAG: GNAT family N-acetyltransferase [Methanocorpusculum sp.]|jgi:putative acetyltransferase|nr:GNAT family N-acetyltransferase [Methanocorpusculum sp.]MDD3257344.1 GNAT family protein [Methanocorpusculum sp.]MDD4133214.1 GNAT family protein [Methanocorpusculum sp.]